MEIEIISPGSSEAPYSSGYMVSGESEFLELDHSGWEIYCIYFERISPYNIKPHTRCVVIEVNNVTNAYRYSVIRIARKDEQELYPSEAYPCIVEILKIDSDDFIHGICENSTLGSIGYVINTRILKMRPIKWETFKYIGGRAHAMIGASNAISCSYTSGIVFYMKNDSDLDEDDKSMYHLMFELMEDDEDIQKQAFCNILQRGMFSLVSMYGDGWRYN